ncbi:hypothetical protein JXQ70_17600 [bacterium]|nr:hypothetical protein [bacterium]
MTVTRSVCFVMSCVLSFFVSACSLNPKISIPPDVLAVNPVEECASYARPDAWDLRATLMESGEKAYLVVHFKPPFDVFHEPWVELKTGPAIYEGREGNLFYYRLGKLMSSPQIGKITFVIRDRSNVMGEMRDDTKTMTMERREGTPCIVFYPI